jgi:hypothetical protein
MIPGDTLPICNRLISKTFSTQPRTFAIQSNLGGLYTRFPSHYSDRCIHRLMEVSWQAH